MADPSDDEARRARTDLTALTGGLPVEASMHPAGSGRTRWAQQELGDLLGPSWLDDAGDAAPGDGAPVGAASMATSSSPAEPGPSGAIWEVERMPSEAEGGVVGLLLSGRRDGDVYTADPAPPAVWFWGDDDIYPGKMPGVVEARPAGGRASR